jgi:class 3 adenylate cyclase
MSTLPSGTVTFVFSDIEGSTALLKRLGDRYGDVLKEHRRLVRKAFGAHGGTEIDTQGDAFFFAFARARDAVVAAVDAQRAHAAHEWPDGADVRVRMGLHTGEPALGEEGYLGIDVVRAARLCTVGRGGHVLLSETTRALLGSSLPEGVTIAPLGERRLKDLDEPERVYQLEIDGLPAAFPPLRTHGEEPLDFEARLERRIQDEVEQMVEQALSGRPGGTPPADDQPEKLAKLAGVGLLVAFFGVLVLAGIVVVLALVVRALF